MTIEQRLEQVEHQNQRIQRTNKRLTVGLTMMAVVVFAVVTMAAIGYKDDMKTSSGAPNAPSPAPLTPSSRFGIVTAHKVIARHILVKNDAGDIVVTLGVNDGGDGLVWTQSAKGKNLVELTSTVDGNGTVSTYQPNGKELVTLNSTDSGGVVQVSNKTGEPIALMHADEYGNGVVWAGNRKGKGRALKPGP